MIRDSLLEELRANPEEYGSMGVLREEAADEIEELREIVAKQKLKIINLTDCVKTADWIRAVLIGWLAKHHSAVKLYDVYRKNVELTDERNEK